MENPRFSSLILVSSWSFARMFFDVAFLDVDLRSCAVLFTSSGNSWTRPFFSLLPVLSVQSIIVLGGEDRAWCVMNSTRLLQCGALRSSAFLSKSQVLALQSTEWSKDQQLRRFDTLTYLRPLWFWGCSPACSSQLAARSLQKIDQFAFATEGNPGGPHTRSFYRCWHPSTSVSFSHRSRCSRRSVGRWRR